MAERASQFKLIERALIDSSAILRSPDELIEQMKERGFSEIDTLETVWSLVRKGELNFDANRNIQASSEHPHQPYLMPPTDF